MRPPEAETPGEKLYEQWDCPQVITKHPYEAHEPDVLNLELGDVVNVTRKLPDGKTILLLTFYAQIMNKNNQRLRLLNRLVSWRTYT